jgi:hypothetical protein
MAVAVITLFRNEELFEIRAVAASATAATVLAHGALRSRLDMELQ